jgi:hypothetical protein
MVQNNTQFIQRLGTGIGKRKAPTGGNRTRLKEKQQMYLEIIKMSEKSKVKMQVDMKNKSVYYGTVDAKSSTGVWRLRTTIGFKAAIDKIAAFSILAYPPISNRGLHGETFKSAGLPLVSGSPTPCNPLFVFLARDNQRSHLNFMTKGGSL